MNYIPIQALFAKIDRDYGMSNLSEADVIDWTGEALGLMGAIKQFEEALAIIEVNDYRCSIPGGGLHKILMIARNNNYSKTIKENNCTPADILLDNTDNTIKRPIVIDCKGQPIEEYELAYYRPYFDLRWEYDQWRNSNRYRNQFTPVRSTTNIFFGISINEDNLYCDSRDEYKLIDRDTLKFSFQEGQIAIAYYRQKLDENGYPMIPDDESVIEACKCYTILRKEKKDYYNKRTGSVAMSEAAEKDWHWYCEQGKSSLKMPKSIDDYQNLLDQRNSLIPRMNEYNSFFGNLNRPEQRRFNNPDLRNKRYGGYI